MFFQDRISGILDAHLSAVSNQLNTVMKVLTLISTIFLPLTVLTGMYGMNVTLPHMPGGDPSGSSGGWSASWWRCPARCWRTSAGSGGFERDRDWSSGYLSPMGRIHRLPLHLANQIAAGEVVERPASVVKELVENALDAGATRIAVAIELGGKKLIRVEDDGEGMEPEDAQLAVERHATSKIRDADDLGAIRTLGFRGEALPSIASVSHFVLRTRARGAESGTEVRIDGGQAASIREVGTREGTSIEVADLFFNLPARRKFLKSDVAESTQVSRLITQLALGYPEIGWSLTSGGRRLLECPPAAGLPERFFQLFGDRPDLLELRKDAAGISIHGYVAALGDHGPVRGPQNVFVNRRIVKDRTIAHAISEAYSVATIKERSPEVHLFIEIPPDRVDVNVHPDQGGGAVPRAVAGARGAAARARRRARPRAGARAAAHAVPGAARRAAADDDSRRARRRDDRQPVDAGAVSDRSADSVRRTGCPPSAWQHRPDGSRWSQPRQAKPARREPGSSRRSTAAS